MADKTSGGQSFHLTCGNNLCTALFPVGHRCNHGASDVPYQLMDCALKTTEKTNWHKDQALTAKHQKLKNRLEKLWFFFVSFLDRQTEPPNEDKNFLGHC